MKNQISSWNAVYRDRQMSQIGSGEGRALGKVGVLPHAEPCEFISNVGIFSRMDLWGAYYVSMLGARTNYPSVLGDNMHGDIGHTG